MVEFHFYCNNLELLPPKPKFTFRHLKKRILEFYRRFVLAPADKAANNIVVIWKRYYINTLKQELVTAKTYEHNRLDEPSIVDRHRFNMAAKFGLFVVYYLNKLGSGPLDDATYQISRL